MARDPIFKPDTKQDGRWHPSRSFSPRPVAVTTLPRNHDFPVIQHHRGAHAVVERWTGTKWEFKSCGDIHKKRSTTWTCSQRFARWLNQQEEKP